MQYEAEHNPYVSLGVWTLIGNIKVNIILACMKEGETP